MSQLPSCLSKTSKQKKQNKSQTVSFIVRNVFFHKPLSAVGVDTVSAET